jgi:hypothetical protein
MQRTGRSDSKPGGHGGNMLKKAIADKELMSAGKMSRSYQNHLTYIDSMQKSLN